jgi:hypothetical protein
MKYNVHQTNRADNTGVVLIEIKKGDVLTGKEGVTLKARDDIPRNHKVALVDIGRDRPVVKYGETIGLAAEDIQAGSWVHTHNIKPAEV